MILRRITKHAKDQNWFAVALDFFIVVVGVFIGIQVSNWNAGSIERTQSNDLLVRMTTEAKETQGALHRYRQTHSDILDRATQFAMRLQDSQTCVSMDDDMKGLILGVGDFPPPRFSLSTATQALNTGQLALISSANVRDGVQVITDELNFIHRQWQRYTRVKQDTEKAVSIASGFAITGSRSNTLSASQSFIADRYKMLTPERICGNADVIALVSNVETTQQIYVGYLEEVQTALDQYLDTLNTYSENDQ
jgi:hypothetical protein